MIQKFITQEETHKSLVSMTKESQAKIEEIAQQKEAAQCRVTEAKYNAGAEEAAPVAVNVTGDGARAHGEEGQTQECWCCGEHAGERVVYGGPLLAWSHSLLHRCLPQQHSLPQHHAASAATTTTAHMNESIDRC